MLRSLQLGMEWFSETPGGVNRLFAGMVQHLPRAGVEVVGLVTGTPAVIEASGGRVRPVCPTDAPMLTRWRRWRRSITAALAQDPAVVPGVHFALYAFPALRQLGGRPLVVHFHGPWALESRAEGAGWLATGAKAMIEGAVYRRGTVCTAESHAFARVLSDRYGVSADRIRVVPGGVEAATFALRISRRDARERLGWSVDRPTFLTIRRLVQRMGLENLIDAAQLIRRQAPDALFLIGGAGPLRAALEGRIKAAGLQATVQLLGRVPEDLLPLVYRGADLTLVPTVALEGFGLVVAESLAAGTPVLVTPVGGLPEAVAGLGEDLVAPGTAPPVLADALREFLRGGLRIPTEAACRAYARDRYDWAVVAALTAGVYRECAR